MQKSSRFLLICRSLQVINNIALSEFNVDISQYTATLKKVIAACMDGVEPEDIINMVVTEYLPSASARSGLALQESDAINVAYEVLGGDTLSFETLSAELIDAVTSGEFTTILQQDATEDGSTGLEDATSSEVTTSATPEETVLMYAEQVGGRVRIGCVCMALD